MKRGRSHYRFQFARKTHFKCGCFTLFSTYLVLKLLEDEARSVIGFDRRWPNLEQDNR